MLSDDLQRLEKRVEVVRQVCHGTIKKLQACATSAGDGGFEKRVVSRTVHRGGDIDQAPFSHKHLQFPC